MLVGPREQNVEKARADSDALVSSVAFVTVVDLPDVIAVNAHARRR
mgnify:CR=1 FL=1